MFIAIFIIFLIGICIGSFLNVVIDRLPQGRSIVHGRSHCEFCKKELAWFDLLPIFSFLQLGGKCRYCHKRLSFQYPLVEFLTSLAFVILFFLETPTGAFSLLLFIIDLVLMSLSIALIVMDIKYHLLLDVLLVQFFLFALLRVLLLNPATLPIHVVWGIVAVLPLLLIYILTKGKGMGFGDVKLIFILGFLLMFPNIIVLYYLAFLTGALVGIILILGKRKKFSGSTIAFGPFLFFGAACALLWGNTLWHYLLILLGF